LILIVDDEGNILKYLERVLLDDGHVVKTTVSPKEALEFAEAYPPMLIISDILMDEMSGFAFREAYQAAHPYRRTPWIYLSSLTANDHVIEGLRRGADDYLLKPVDAEILRVKVSSILRMRWRNLSTSFEGKLEDFPVERLFAYCQESGLTGALILQTTSVEYMWTFKFGRILNEIDSVENILSRMRTIRTGSFQILAQPPSFDDLTRSDGGADGDSAPAALANSALDPNVRECGPTGILSGMQVGNRKIDIQTELAGSESQMVISTVYAGGRILHKAEHRLEDGWSTRQINEAIRGLHQRTMRDLETRLAEKMKA
jgi:CheY-like chemotaxis protein